MKKIIVLVFLVANFYYGHCQTTNVNPALSTLLDLTKVKDISKISQQLSKYGFVKDNFDSTWESGRLIFDYKFIRYGKNKALFDIITLSGEKENDFWQLFFSSSKSDLYLIYNSQVVKLKYKPINCPPRRPQDKDIYNCFQNAVRAITFARGKALGISTQIMILHDFKIN